MLASKNASQQGVSYLDHVLPNAVYGEWYHNVVALVLTAVASWLLAKCGASIGTLLVACFCLATYYQTSMRRFRTNARDEIQRELAKIRLESDEEPVEWINSFLQKFWLIFEPVLSALVVENLDTVINAYLPSYVDSVKLTTFTLGTKPFRVESVKTYQNTDPDTVCMDWKVSFTPSDLTDVTVQESQLKVNPRITILVRFGKGSIGTGVPCLVEDMQFQGHMRVKIKFIARFPFAKLVDVCFLEKPNFDYILKPLGSDNFGFDVNYIPGLYSFIREQVHAILGPMLYSPNTFTLDLEKLMAGELDMTQANGVLAVTIYNCSSIRNMDQLFQTSPNPYVRFYLDHGQELGRTSIKEQTKQPSWNETRFLLLNNLSAQLCMELRTHNPGGKDRRLGTAQFDLRHLDDENHREEEGLDLMLLRNGKVISDLRLDIRYLPVSKPIKRLDGTTEPAIESNSGILRVSVLACRDLKLPGRPSTHVRVIVNGSEKFKTAVVKRSLSPSFAHTDELVILDKTDVFMRIELWHNDKELRLTGSCTAPLTEMMRLQEAQAGWWPLATTGSNNNSNGDVGSIHLHFEWKPVLMAGLADRVGRHGFNEPPIGAIRFTFWQAKDLRNVEAVTNGKSDPYVRVLSGHQVRGRTTVIDNDLNPEWGETLYIPVHSTKENLVLEVMDWNARSPDKSLGITTVTMADLVRQRVGDQSVDPDRWYEAAHGPVNKWAQLRSMDRRVAKGELFFRMEFLPVVALPRTLKPFQCDLHNHPVRYTPDNLVDTLSYSSGVLRIKIHEVQLPTFAYAYCQVAIDSLLPQFKTSKLRGQNLAFDEIGTVFVKELDFSRVAIEIKPISLDEKDERRIAQWVSSASSIVHHVQKWRRDHPDDKDAWDAEGTWFDLMGTAQGQGAIRLSFDYIPCSSFQLNPDESLDNQGTLSCTLLKATNLMPADKNGLSDPYVIFTVNGERCHKSAVIRKTLNPEWKNETFSVSIASRVTASIRIEVFDWNHVKGHYPIGSGGITLRGDNVESFSVKDMEIPLDGVSGVSGSVFVRFLWHPRLLANKKTYTSAALGDSQAYAGPAQHLEPASRLSIDSTSRLSVDSRSSSPNLPEDTMSDDQNALSRTTSRGSMPAPESVLSLDQAAMLISDTSGGHGIVTVKIVEARGLRGVDSSGTSDPFVRVRVGSNEVYKTRVVKKNLRPEWNETFTQAIAPSPTLFDFKVKDHNKLHRAVDLGETRFNIWDLVQPNFSFDQWIPLYPTGSGEIHLRIDYEPAPEHPDM
ncbi:C2 domain-containing protein [Gongronella butleri]|nr:C2 domain-containing protein [Gongronella butleri]